MEPPRRLRHEEDAAGQRRSGLHVGAEVGVLLGQRGEETERHARRADDQVELRAHVQPGHDVRVGQHALPEGWVGDDPVDRPQRALDRGGGQARIADGGVDLREEAGGDGLGIHHDRHRQARRQDRR